MNEDDDVNVSMGEKTLACSVAKLLHFSKGPLAFDGICFGGRSPLPALPVACLGSLRWWTVTQSNTQGSEALVVGRTRTSMLQACSKQKCMSMTDPRQQKFRPLRHFSVIKEIQDLGPFASLKKQA